MWWFPAMEKLHSVVGLSLQFGCFANLCDVLWDDPYIHIQCGTQWWELTRKYRQLRPREQYSVYSCVKDDALRHPKYCTSRLRIFNKLNGLMELNPEIKYNSAESIKLGVVTNMCA